MNSSVILVPGAPEKVLVGLTNPSGTRLLMDLRQRSDSIVAVYHDPQLPSHLTVHDADATHTSGVIHTKVDPRKAVVTQWPGGHQVSDERGTVQPQRTIPPFREIKGVEIVFNPYGSSLSPLDAIIGGLPTIKPRTSKHAFLIPIEVVGTCVGAEILLVETGNRAALEQWISDTWAPWELMYHRPVSGSVHVFTGFEPWHAVATFSI